MGCGRGGTTRHLVELLKGFSTARLIATDISDAFFTQLEDEFRDSGVDIVFQKTGACELEGIAASSIDYLICNYTLCAVNAQGEVVPAIQRFHEVLRPESWLFVEEEFPISYASNPRQAVWAQKWRILKAAAWLAGEEPFVEIYPEVMAATCRTSGFRQVNWSGAVSAYESYDALAFFVRRLSRLVGGCRTIRCSAG